MRSPRAAPSCPSGRTRPVDLRVGHLYPDLMNIYGDKGNVIALAQRARWRGVEVEVRPYSLGEWTDADWPDVWFFGGGQDQGQDLVGADLAGKNGAALKRSVEAGAAIFSVCGGYQLLGHEYVPESGPAIPGVGILDGATRAGKKRLVGTLLPALGALPADADDGRPQSGGGGHPPSPVPIPKSQLGPSAIQTAPIPSVAPESLPRPPQTNRGAAKKELVIFIGGYGSSREENDGVCADVRTWFDPGRYEIACFGDDPAFPYDTYGPVDDSARTLIAQIRSQPEKYSSVDIIAHSMGGVVADRAFADGLSSTDGVAVSVAIASPHSGSKYARVSTVALPLVTPVADIIRAEAVRYSSDPQSLAANDLASFRSVR